MVTYWLLLAYFALGSLLERPRVQALSKASLPLVIGILIVAVVAGLRYKVGADWTAYQYIFEAAARAPLERAMELGDPGYLLLNWLVGVIGGEFWLVNLCSAFIFGWGLLKFLETRSRPWLAMAVAIPYLVIVVAMGYTRQAVALGVIMAGLASFIRSGSVLRFAAYVAIAALFHRTAVVALLVVALAGERGRLVNTIILAAVGVLFYDFFLSESVDTLVRNYIESAYSSQGAAIRLAMSLLAAAIFLVAPRRFGFSIREKHMWRNFSLATLGLTVLLFVLPSSTAVDRLALYMIPLQLAVFSAVPGAFAAPRLGAFLILSYAFAVQFIWLNFAVHAQYWVPYRLYPVNFGG